MYKIKRITAFAILFLILPSICFLIVVGDRTAEGKFPFRDMENLFPHVPHGVQQWSEVVFSEETVARQMRPSEIKTGFKEGRLLSLFGVAPEKESILKDSSIFVLLFIRSFVFLLEIIMMYIYKHDGKKRFIPLMIR